MNILKIKTSQMPVSKLFDMQKFSKKLLGLSGAEITFVVNEAAYNTLRRSIDIKDSRKQKIKPNYNKLIVENEDFEKALATLKAEKQTNAKMGY
jgi:transitional endoplasmic reticulum ATPase